jgi:hypothetical protein
MAILSPSGAFGYDFRLLPSLSAREEYNSNLFFTRENREDSWVTTVIPGLEAAGKTERLDAALSGNLRWLRYNADPSLDAKEYAARGRLGYRFTPEFRVAGAGEYRKESRPDRHFEEAGLLDSSKDYRQDYTFLTEWAVTEKAAATMSYAFERLDYPALPQRNSTNHSVDLGVAYNLKRFSEETRGRVNLGFSRGIYEGLTINNSTLSFGVSRAVHELWSVVANVGGRYTKSEFDAPGGMQEDGSTGWVADASIVYTGERSYGSFTFFHDVAPAYGFGGATLRTAAVLNLRRRFLYSLSGTLATGYYWNKSLAGQFSTQAIEEQSARLRPGLRWEATKNIALDAAYQYTWLKNELTGGKAVQNVFYAGATLSYPFFDE